MEDFCKFCCYTINGHEHDGDLEYLIDGDVIPLRMQKKFNFSESGNDASIEMNFKMDTEVGIVAAIFEEGNFYVFVDENSYEDRFFETAPSETLDTYIYRKTIKFNYCPMCGRNLTGDS